LDTLYVYVILMRDICHHGYSSFHLYVHDPAASTKICDGYARYKDESVRRCYYFTNYFSRSCDSCDSSWHWKHYILWVTLPASCKKQVCHYKRKLAELIIEVLFVSYKRIHSDIFTVQWGYVADSNVIFAQAWANIRRNDNCSHLFIRQEK